MKFNKILKGIGYLTSLIIIGWITNALWEYTKPIIPVIGNKTLAFMSILITGYRDSIYREIAIGFHESESLRVLSIMSFQTGLILGVFTGLILSFYFIVKGKYDRLNFESNVIKKMIGDISDRRSFARKVIYVTISIVIIYIIIFNLQNAKTAYINRANTYYNQLLKITSPYIDDQHEEIIQSAFAQIKTKNDYEEVINILRKIAYNNNISTPEFNIW